MPRPLPHVLKIAPYEWEASNADVAQLAGIPESEVVRLDTNTAPWPPVAWDRTLEDMPRLPANEYPHPSNEPLRSALAESLGVNPDQVVVTNGADEALFYIGQVYLEPGRKAVMPTPSFAMFRVITEEFGAELVGVPVDEHWQIDAEAVLAAVRDEAVGVVWLCSPNNPTGQLIPAEVIEAVADAAPHAVVVVDEAYYEIAGVTNFALLAKHPNLVIVRTFSKGYGLAGARVGYCIAARDITQHIDAVRMPQNLSAFSINAAYRAFQDQDGLEERVDQLQEERERLMVELQKRGWEVIPSHGNFLLTKPPIPADELSDILQKHGLVVRSYGANPRLADYVRVTVRSPEEDQRLLDVLDSLART